jgi:hypothetical protein
MERNREQAPICDALGDERVGNLEAVIAGSNDLALSR